MDAACPAQVAPFDFPQLGVQGTLERSDIAVFRKHGGQLSNEDRQTERTRNAEPEVVRNITRRLRFHQRCDLDPVVRDEDDGDSDVNTDESREIRCNLCPDTFKVLDKNRHYEMVHDGFRLKCTVCDTRFVKRAEIREHHVAVHKKGKNFVCPVCDKGFPKITYLSHHVKWHDSSALCDKCGQVVIGGYESNMERHRRTQCPVTRVKGFKCELCDKEFYTQHDLRTHELKHSGKRPFKCPVCNKGFYQKKTLNKHVRIHTDERPFRCNVCGKGFRQDGPLLYHMSTHTGKKKVTCPDCGKRFMYVSHMKQHKCFRSKTEQDASGTRRKSRSGANAGRKRNKVVGIGFAAQDIEIAGFVSGKLASFDI